MLAVSSGTTSQLLWEESTFWMLSSTISFRILIHQWVPLHCIFSLKLSNSSLSGLEAKKYSSISYFKSKYKPLLTISFPLVITFRLKFPGKMVYPPIPSSNHGHYFASPPFCWRWCITKSNWHLFIFSILMFLPEF